MNQRDASVDGGSLSRSALREQDIGAILAAVDAFLAQRSIVGTLAQRTRLVIEELVANAFRHGGAAETGGVGVLLKVELASPVGSVSYVGPAFDPTGRWAETRSDESRIGGRGLPLIQGLTRRLKFSRKGEVNRVEFEISTGDVA